MLPLVFRLSTVEYLSYGLLHILHSAVWWWCLKFKIKCHYAFVHHPFDSVFGLLVSGRGSLHQLLSLGQSITQTYLEMRLKLSNQRVGPRVSSVLCQICKGAKNNFPASLLPLQQLPLNVCLQRSSRAGCSGLSHWHNGGKITKASLEDIKA